MKTFFRRLLILLVAVVCLFAPTFIRSTWLGYNQRSYRPPAIDAFNLATTPEPTNTPFASGQPANISNQPLLRGPIVVDLAHFNRLNPSSFQPLAAELAAQGVGMRFWISNIDVTAMDSFLDFPDQADGLATQLVDASGLIVISPFFLWSKQEIAQVEAFVANGGRLFLISDPDVQGDWATVTNMVAEPFGIVFNDDYLYDTVENDENYTYFFQKTFLDQASTLSDSRIAFYGGRSISGAVIDQVRSAPTTLSSLRTGLSDFTTVAIGGQEANESSGRVLAMSDFDVLTEPYVTRHDNHNILTFVADFLGGSQREDALVNFPTYLDKNVALVIDSSDGINAALLGQGAQLQQRLAQTGRTLTLGGTALLTATQAVSTGVATTTTPDLIYLADFEAANTTSALLQVIGITLVKEEIIPTLTPTVLPSATPGATATAAAPEEDGAPVPFATARPTLTLTAPAISTPIRTAATPTVTPEPGQPTGEITSTLTTTDTTSDLQDSPIDAASTATTDDDEPVATATPEPTPTPQITFFLETEDGLRLLASETLLIVQRQQTDDQRIVAVLGFDDTSVQAGVGRLLADNLKDCMLRRDLAICPATASEAPSAETAPETTGAPTITPTPTADAASEPDPDIAPQRPHRDLAAILLVDDNDGAESNELSEADFYLQVLTQAGHDVTLWTTAADGVPTGEDLGGYGWVIWSDAAYADSGIDPEKLQAISDYLGVGGKLLISSQLPFFGVGGDPATTITDVVVGDTNIPILVRDLPTDPIELPADLPAVTPLQLIHETDTPTIVLRRGPQSENADAPVLLIMTDAEDPNPGGARLMIFGMSITWLPQDVGAQLVRNMAEYMLSE